MCFEAEYKHVYSVHRLHSSVAQHCNMKFLLRTLAGMILLKWCHGLSKFSGAHLAITCFRYDFLMTSISPCRKLSLPVRGLSPHES